MKWLTFKIQKSPGFRFNLTDLILICALVILSTGVYVIYPYNCYFLLPVYIGVSFFLFCNVFRIGNRLEPWWYLTFLVITLISVQDPALYWPLMLGACEPLKIFLIIYRIRQPDYVGIFAKPGSYQIGNPD